MEICKACNREFKNRVSLGRHIVMGHKITGEEYTLKYLYNGIVPNCACGCGSVVKYCKDYPFTYRTYYPGHYALHHPEIWGDKSDPARAAKAATTYKERYAKGEIVNPWKGKTKYEIAHIMKFSIYSSKEHNPAKAKETSEKLKGVKKSPEHIANMKIAVEKYCHTPEHKKKCSDIKIEWIKKNHKQYTSKLETYFIDNYLVPNKVGFERNFYGKEIKSFYDFYIPRCNTIIEVDGDYWHCNPAKYSEPKYTPQKKNVERDAVKNKWAVDNGYTILRFWETDIIKNPKSVLETLKLHGIVTDDAL